MDKKRGLLAFLLFVLTVAFIAFVIIMQHNFANPEFATAQSQTVDAETDKSKEDSDSNGGNEEKESEKDEDESETTKYVVADLLNVRSEPNLEESTIIYTLRHNDEVTVESIEESDEWVKVTTDEFTGYVKDKYLAEK